MFTSEAECQAYMAQIIPTGDTILQAWRISQHPYKHVGEILKDAGVLDCFGNDNLDPMNVYDVGCGTGEFMWLVQNSLPNATIRGCNFFDAQTAFGRAQAGLNIITVDFTELQVPEETEDIVFCNYTLGYFDDPVPVLEKIWKMLKPGGKLIMWDAAAAHLACTFALGYHLRRPCEIRWAAEQAGFSDVKTTWYPGRAKLSKAMYQIASKQQLKIFKKMSVPLLTVGVKK